MTKAVWMLHAKKADFNGLAARFHISPITARIIRNRDITDIDEFDKYLNGSLKDLYEPRLLPDMEKAISILKEKIAAGARIRIVGDYDIDGVCSTCILYKGLSRVGAKVDYVIPERIKDGYGINEHIIEKAAADGIHMILTCDNGIAAIDQIAEAKELGMTVVITPIVKGLAAIGIKVNFFGDNVVLGSMANITTWTFTGYNMLIFLAALQAIPHDLYEAARIDGASGFQIAMKIKLPNVRAAALLAMLLSIVGTIQLFNEPQVMSISDPSISKSYTPMMMALNTSQGTLTPGGDGPASAVAIVMALIAGVLAVVYTLVERKVNAE